MPIRYWPRYLSIRLSTLTRSFAHKQRRRIGVGVTYTHTRTRMWCTSAGVSWPFSDCDDILRLLMRMENLHIAYSTFNHTNFFTKLILTNFTCVRFTLLIYWYFRFDFESSSITSVRLITQPLHSRCKCWPWLSIRFAVCTIWKRKHNEKCKCFVCNA